MEAFLVASLLKLIMGQFFTSPAASALRALSLLILIPTGISIKPAIMKAGRMI